MKAIPMSSLKKIQLLTTLFTLTLLVRPLWADLEPKSLENFDRESTAFIGLSQNENVEVDNINTFSSLEKRPNIDFHDVFIEEKVNKPGVKEEEGLKKSAYFADGHFIVESGVETTYDSNVFYYSRDEVDAFDAGANTNDRFTNIKSVDDIIFSPYLDLAYKNLWFGHTFKTGVIFVPHCYTYNKVKDYEDYEFYAKQYLNKDEFVEFNYGKTPDYMEGNFYDRDFARYKEANYAEDRFALGYNKPITQTMSAMAQYFYLINNYNENFNEYDMQGNAVRLSLRNAFTSKFTTRLYGEYAREDAKGNLNETARVESDSSRQIWKTNLRGTYAFTSKFQMYVQYGIWFIDYTTGHALADDPYHANRDDILQTLGCHLGYDLIKNLQIFLSYQYTMKDADPATDDRSILDAAILGYERHQVSTGVKFLF